jgi:hypothetical protein
VSAQILAANLDIPACRMLAANDAKGTTVDQDEVQCFLAHFFAEGSNLSTAQVTAGERAFATFDVT